MHGIPPSNAGLSRSFNIIAKATAVGALTLTLSACSALSAFMPSGLSNDNDYSLISSNLLDAVSQYPELESMLADAQLSETDNDFERQVFKDLSARGYSLEHSSSTDSGAIINASVRAVDENVGQAFPLYIVSIGDMSAERQFDVIDGAALPASELIIRGAEVRDIALNDKELFDVPADATLSTVVFKPANFNKSPVLEQLLNPEPPSRVTGLWNRPKQSPVKVNIYDTMESNYSAMFTEYEDIDSSVLIFPNDSLQLGEVNKVIIEQFVEQMDSKTDILSVIGCSHGRTDISNGNSLLAIGRANRVKEALMFSGVDHNHVLEEGCWAPTTFDGALPNRGVVLTLKRQKNS